MFGEQETEDTTSDPVFNYVYIGDDLSDGLFTWILIGINPSASYSKSIVDMTVLHDRLSHDNGSMTGNSIADLPPRLSPNIRL